MSSFALLIDKYFPGDSMVPSLVAFADLDDVNRAYVTRLAQYFWFFRFQAPHPKLRAHERNPEWVWRTLECCKEWGCPTPCWALDYVTNIGLRRGRCRWPTKADKRRAAAFLEAIEKSAIPDESRTYDIPWGERPRLTQQERQRAKTRIADEQGTRTSEETSMRLLGAVEIHWVEWMNLR
jgi:hypothetical protein